MEQTFFTLNSLFLYRYGIVVIGIIFYFLLFITFRECMYDLRYKKL